MKKLNLSMIAVALALFINAQKGAYIEFKINSSKGATGSMKINYSEFGYGSEFNMVIPQMPGGGIVNKSIANKENPDSIYLLNDKTKTYSTIKKNDSQNEDTKTYTVKKVGEETVNGYKCVHALVTEGTETTDVWNTKDIKEYNDYKATYASNKRMGSLKREQALKDAGCDGFPVKTIHKGNEREGDMTMELVKIEKKSFLKSDFAIPADYTRSGSAAGGANMNPAGIKSQQEIMNMTPEERNKYIEELKAKYKKN